MSELDLSGADHFFFPRGGIDALFQCTWRDVLVEGRAGTAKTTGILSKILWRCWRFPGSRHLICRQTRASLTDSVMVTLDRLLRQIGGACEFEVNRQVRESRHAYQVFGSEIVCGGLDKPDKLFSTEWDTIYMAEAVEVKTIEPWDLFNRSLRHYACDYHQKIADCNPGPPNHWLNKRATKAADWLRDCWKTKDDYYGKLRDFNNNQTPGGDRPMWRIISTHPDNPGYWDADKWDWTKEGREYVTEQLMTMTGHRRSRMLDGRWKAADNVVYPEFDELKHVVDPFPKRIEADEQGNPVQVITIPDGYQIVVGTDPGFDHPTAILWFATSVKGGEPVYIFDEIYEGGKSIQQHGVSIRQHNRGRTVLRYYGDPQHAFSMTAQAPESIAMQYKKYCGITLSPWPRTGGNEETMVEAVREKLRNEMLFVCRNCENTISEFQSWSFKRDMKGNMTGGEDKYEDAQNHAMDVVKGIVATGFGRKKSIIRATGGST